MLITVMSAGGSQWSHYNYSSSPANASNARILRFYVHRNEFNWPNGAEMETFSRLFNTTALPSSAHTTTADRTKQFGVKSVKYLRQICEWFSSASAFKCLPGPCSKCPCTVHYWQWFYDWFWYRLKLMQSACKSAFLLCLKNCVESPQNSQNAAAESVNYTCTECWVFWRRIVASQPGK